MTLQQTADWRALDPLPTRERDYTGPLDAGLPQFLFLAIVFSIPFFEYRQLPGPEWLKVDFVLTFFLLLIIGPGIAAMRSMPERVGSNLWGLLALFFMVNLVSTLLSDYPDWTRAGMITLLQSALFILIVQLMSNLRTTEQQLPWTITLSMLVAATLSNLGFYLGVDAFTTQGMGGLEVRAAGATIGANNMALMCCFALPIAAYCAMFSRTTFARWVGWVSFVSIILAIIATTSRGGFLNMMVVLFLLFLQYRSRFEIRYFGLVIAGVAFSLMIVVALVPPEYVARQLTVLELGTRAADKSLSRRSAYVKVGLQAYAERPLIGHGANAFPKIWLNSYETRKFDLVERPAHNTYVEVATATGTLGLIIFFLLIARAFLNLREAERTSKVLGDDEGAQLAAAYRISLLALLSYFLVKSGLDHKYFLLILPVSWAVLRRARRLEDEAAEGLGGAGI